LLELGCNDLPNTSENQPDGTIQHVKGK